jgi:hypothetical protein
MPALLLPKDFHQWSMEQNRQVARYFDAYLTVLTQHPEFPANWIWLLEAVANWWGLREVKELTARLDGSVDDYVRTRAGGLCFARFLETRCGPLLLRDRIWTDLESSPFLALAKAAETDVATLLEEFFVWAAQNELMSATSLNGEIAIELDHASARVISLDDSGIHSLDIQFANWKARLKLRILLWDGYRYVRIFPTADATLQLKAPRGHLLLMNCGFLSRGDYPLHDDDIRVGVVSLRAVKAER